jgi:hypothetical protein
MDFGYLAVLMTMKLLLMTMRTKREMMMKIAAMVTVMNKQTVTIPITILLPLVMRRAIMTIMEMMKLMITTKIPTIHHSLVIMIMLLSFPHLTITKKMMMIIILNEIVMTTGIGITTMMTKIMTLTVGLP